MQDPQGAPGASTTATVNDPVNGVRNGSRTQASAEEHLRRLKERGAAPPSDEEKPGKEEGPEEWFLNDAHRKELHTDSGIDPDVVKERGYETLTAPSSGNSLSRERLEKLRIPAWAMKGDGRWPILGIPIYDARGRLVSYQAKPRTPASDDNGKPRKYASPTRVPAKVDVHPRNRDKIVDPTVDLWITEGVKKGDALTSRGACVATLSGVFNWRNQLGELGDWENILIKGRVVNVCFDSDALINRNVLRAMVRCVQWVKYRGAKEVYFLIVPEEVNGVKVKGADDFLAAGGTMQQLLDERTTIRPTINTNADTFSDARMAETVAFEVLDDRFMWVSGLGWMEHTGKVWEKCPDVTVSEQIRLWALDRYGRVLEQERAQAGSVPEAVLNGWRSMLSKPRRSNLLTEARGVVQVRLDALDAEPDWINTQTCVVDMMTGETMAHDPNHLMTHITAGGYVDDGTLAGFTHDDWTLALEALDPDEREYLQLRIGQAITGHPTPDGVMPILQGGGENGKSAVTTDGLVPALGDYASMASPKLFQSTKGSEHSTERAELRGKRLVIAEELTEGRSIDVTALKQITDVGMITARFIRQDNMTFKASHSLMVTTNHIPVVSETDHGTWRRLQLIQFPYTYRKPGQALQGPNDRHGDPMLKRRIKDNKTGQFDAIVTWAIKGAIEYNDSPEFGLMPPIGVENATTAWRNEADRIQGFWEEFLTADADACMATSDVLWMFNRWLKGNGHSEWAKETFGPRFEHHTMTTKHGVSKKQVKNPKNLIRPPGAGVYRDPWERDQGPAELPERPWVYLGVRLQTPLDQGI